MSGVLLTAGLDEAGRGPLAGPVTAGCVVLPEDFPLELLDDSKKLSAKKRAQALRCIRESACWGLGVVEHDEIDRINILRASLKAMRLAYEDMLTRFGAWCRERGLPGAGLQAVADGNHAPELGIPVRAEVRADARFACVMAASIVAKEERDALMLRYDALYPQYGYARHKGYPTEEHRRICRELGPSPIQRRTFSYKDPQPDLPGLL